jgi:phosphatidylglycerophosphate synthase
MILGLPWIARIVLSARREGFDPVVIAAPSRIAEIRASLNGANVPVVGAGEAPLAISSGRIAIVSMRILPEPRWFRGLAQAVLGRDRISIDGLDAALLETDDSKEVAALLAPCLDAGAALLALSRRYTKSESPVPVDGRLLVTNSAAVPAAKRWLLNGLIKDTEGLISRHVNRRISLAVSRGLAGTRVTPNAMTGVSVAIGLAGAMLFLSPSKAFGVVGASLFLLHSILDGCDGELARLKFLESRLGGVLDYWGDNIVHAAVFLCLGIGWSRSANALWPLGLGATAAATALLSAALVYHRTMRKPREGPLFTSVSRVSGGRLSRVADALARRDFIYLVLLLAIVGRLHWFLILSAIGSPIFLIVLLWIAASDRKRERVWE